MTTFLIIFGIGIVTFVFWLRMFIAAVRNEYDHKPLWIIILLIGSIIGAIAFRVSVYKNIKQSGDAHKAPAQN